MTVSPTSQRSRGRLPRTCSQGRCSSLSGNAARLDTATHEFGHLLGLGHSTQSDHPGTTVLEAYYKVPFDKGYIDIVDIRHPGAAVFWEIKPDNDRGKLAGLVQIRRRLDASRHEDFWIANQRVSLALGTDYTNRTLAAGTLILTARQFQAGLIVYRWESKIPPIVFRVERKDERQKEEERERETITTVTPWEQLIPQPLIFPSVGAPVLPGLDLPLAPGFGFKDVFDEPDQLFPQPEDPLFDFLTLIGIG